MDTPTPKTSFRWPIVLVSACSVLVLLACAFSAAVGTGGLWLSSRLAKANAPASHNPALTPQTAEIQELRGRVEIQGADQHWTAATENQTMTAGQHLRAGALSSASLIFADGSRALLSANSELAIDELNAPSGGKRVILLTQVTGESDHQVAKTNSKDSRYEVRTPAGSGQAKGTKFHVAVTPAQTAYFYVEEGTVAVTGGTLEQTVLVNAGEMTIIIINLPPLEPLTSLALQGVVTQTGDTWIIGGQNVQVNDQTIRVGDPKTGDYVLVKGHLLADGTKTADWIIRVYTPPVNEFRLTGKVDSTGDKEWKVNGQTIAVTEETEIDTGIAAGDMVQVVGVVLPGGTLQASSIRRVDSELGLPFDFTGIIEETGENTWKISGVTVTVTGDTELDGGLKAGDRVRARGYIQKDGAWAAESIVRLEDGANSFEFTGTLESKDPWKVSGISFETRDWTEIADNLKIGEQVLVEGIIDENGVWIATRIERLSDSTSGRIILIGVVVGTNPWVVSGITIQVNESTVIIGDIKVGMLVRVEMILQADGTWLAVKIQPLSTVIWFPGCFDIIATVVSINGQELQLLNWPLLHLDTDVQVTQGEDDQGENEDGNDGDSGGTVTLLPGSTVRIRICFNEDMTIHIVYIIIIQQPTVDQPDEDTPATGKVTVCHKPGKKGGHTLSIGSSALPAHLGHGDYEGACR